MTVPLIEQRPKPAPPPPRRDPELTLTSGMLVAIVCGLVLLCGLCFGLGYTVGHHHSSQDPVIAAQPVDSVQPVPEVSASASKPSANKQSATSGAASTTPDGGGQAGDPAATTVADSQAGASSGSSQPGAAGGASPAPSEPTSTQAQPAQARPVAPAMSTNPQPAQPATEFASGARVQSALSPQATFLVQIASVSHVEDASVLVNALRKRGYTVTAQRKPEDGLIHVWIGPFSSRDEAHRWKLKLLDDGYNAIVQQ